MQNKQFPVTKYTYTFEDGTTCEMTLAFYALYQLKGKNKDLYDRYNKMMTKASKDEAEELDTITILYAAYCCANLNEENIMSEEEFMMKCGSDREAVVKAAQALTQPKKQKASVNRS